MWYVSIHNYVQFLVSVSNAPSNDQGILCNIWFLKSSKDFAPIVDE